MWNWQNAPVTITSGNAQSMNGMEMKESEPRWPAIAAAMGTGLLFYAMPEALTIGPRWLLLVLVLILMIPTVITHRAGLVDWNERFAYVGLGVTTLAEISSLGLLIMRLPAHKE